ncbi:MAG TPA: metallophosphoesterase [Gemmatimonadaceae bacterium]|nr:metallophosphoesterase [Gemmatimonadaceae bacterium]
MRTDGRTDARAPAPAESAAHDGERRSGGDRRRDARVRIAAVADIHCGMTDVGTYRDRLAAANDAADVLVLAGDLTQRGSAEEFHVLVGELADVKVPVVAVLGNHDHESAQVAQGTEMLRGRGVHVLCGDTFAMDERVGFAGVTGYMGGFGRGTLTAFGEEATKAFVGVAIAEANRLELALRGLRTPLRVVVLHYAPVQATVVGEPESIYPFLGTDRLAAPIDRFGASLVFHGHAHTGRFRGETPGGVPVFNVSLPILHREGKGSTFYVHEMQVPGEQRLPSEPAASEAAP